MKGASEKAPPPAGTSQNPEQLGSELSEIVSARPKLSSEIRDAVLTRLRAAKANHQAVTCCSRAGSLLSGPNRLFKRSEKPGSRQDN